LKTARAGESVRVCIKGKKKEMKERRMKRKKEIAGEE
jgi:hypothetical protein